MKPLGLILSIAALLAPLIWLPALAMTHDVVAILSQYLGLAALIAMSLGQVIATRWRSVEMVFGPLDQSYRLHKWLGIGAMAAVLLHDTVDAEIRGLGTETLVTELAETLGEISLYGLLILVVITIATFIPYHLWKWTHRLIGTFFVMGALHYLFILKPYANLDPLGVYMLVVCGIGAMALAYTAAPRVFRPFRRFRITDLHREGGAVAVTLAPERLGLKYRAGQFAFVSFPDSGLTEPHPFTISTAPREDQNLRVTIAPLGDYTRRVIDALHEGASARIEGPYGRFGAHLGGSQIWVAAGIGVTPFLALAGLLVDKQKHGQLSADTKVRMIFCARDTNNAPHLAELQSLAAQLPCFELTFWNTGERGRLTAEALADLSGTALQKSRVLFCGPVDMRRSLQTNLLPYGVTARRFEYEAFQIRSGLGLRSFLARLARFRDRVAG